MQGDVSLPDGGTMTEDIAAPQHDNERHQQESRDGCESDEQKEAWQRNKGKEISKKICI